MAKSSLLWRDNDSGIYGSPQIKSKLIFYLKYSIEIAQSCPDSWEQLWKGWIPQNESFQGMEENWVSDGLGRTKEVQCYSWEE